MHNRPAPRRYFATRQEGVRVPLLWRFTRGRLSAVCGARELGCCASALPSAGLRRDPGKICTISAIPDPHTAPPDDGKGAEEHRGSFDHSRARAVGSSKTDAPLPHGQRAAAPSHMLGSADPTRS